MSLIIRETKLNPILSKSGIPGFDYCLKTYRRLCTTSHWCFGISAYPEVRKISLFYGMPILDMDKAKNVIVCMRIMAPGHPGTWICRDRQ